MKTYVLIVSNYFPKTHIRSGENTFFPEKILNCLQNKKIITKRQFNDYSYILNSENINHCKWEGKKLHTIRSNFNLWNKRAIEINESKAILSVRFWSGKPYNSKQIEFLKLTKIAIEELTFYKSDFNCMLVNNEYCFADIDKSIAKNDGLDFNDFKDWFKNYDLSKPMAIIHFTDFRYCA